MSKFFYTTDVNGLDHLLNIDYVVQLIPKEQDWSKGALLFMDKQAHGPGAIYIDAAEGRRVKEILKPH